MKIYKFGGASVRSAEGVANLCRIVKGEQGALFIVVSAMGKTTNALELVLEDFIGGNTASALDRLHEIEQYHREIMAGLLHQGEDFSADGISAGTNRVGALFSELGGLLAAASKRDDYDSWYDRIVSYGELISTTIVSGYLAAQGVPNRWLDMRRCFVTDSRHREANINVDRSTLLLRQAVDAFPEQVFVAQGFIGATPGGCPTTLGREGSDYSAAMAGYILGADSVTIWKDVEGVLNADPRLFSDAVHIPQLTYLDAIELAYSGAQVIHPKTIKPLQNKGIPLYVKPFLAPDHAGTLICGRIDTPIGVPILILKQRQVLISIRPKDFSFVLDESLPEIFSVFNQYRQKINLIQSSAVNLSLCVDDSRYLERVVDTLQTGFRVVYNKGMELLTVRGYDDASYRRLAGAEGVYLVQKTRRTMRVVRLAGSSGVSAVVAK